VQYRELSNAAGVVRFDEMDGEFARSAIAIRVGNQTLGSIWAIETERGLDDAGIEGGETARRAHQYTEVPPAEDS
jgi:hypothetical protein